MKNPLKIIAPVMLFAMTSKAQFKDAPLITKVKAGYSSMIGQAPYVQKPGFVGFDITKDFIDDAITPYASVGMNVPMLGHTGEERKQGFYANSVIVNDIGTAKCNAFAALGGKMKIIDNEDVGLDLHFAFQENFLVTKKDNDKTKLHGVPSGRFGTEFHYKLLFVGADIFSLFRKTTHANDFIGSGNDWKPDPGQDATQCELTAGLRLEIP